MKGHYSTFVVRIWDIEAENRFRGSVQHTATQEKRYFSDLTEMSRFILEHLRISVNGAVSFPDKNEG